MIRLGVVGLGKMGLSHLAIFRAHPGVEVAAVCDKSSYVLAVLGRYTGVATYDSMATMVAEADLDAVVIATPSASHAALVRIALDQGLDVFCEKPFCLDAAESVRLSDLADRLGMVTQVGYHYRFVGAFAEVKRLLDAGAIGHVTHVLGEAYGPVVLQTRGGTWRSVKGAGGGSLYDYAAHPLNLINWYFGTPHNVSGTVLNRVFSAETDDEVYATLLHDDGVSAQLAVNWSDGSQRKMSTKISVWGTGGRIVADRQEVHVYLRGTEPLPDGFRAGWNIRNTTELTDPVWFYLRGEEYSAQAADFVHRVRSRTMSGTNDFRSAAETDLTLELLVHDAEDRPTLPVARTTALGHVRPRDRIERIGRRLRRRGKDVA